MKLIINADDFGMSKSVNDAVFELCKLGSISSTSVMVNMPFASDIEGVLPYKNISIGLHINLTQGKPVSFSPVVTTLVDENGFFYKKNVLLSRISKGLVDYEHIKVEIFAQYYALKAKVGDRLSHFDSHQGSTRINIVYRALLELIKKEKLKLSIRVHSKYYLLRDDNFSQVIEPNIFNISKFGFKRILIEHVFRRKRNKWHKYFSSPDGMLFTISNKTIDILSTIVSVATLRKSSKVFEISCHPSVDMKDLSDTKMLEVRVEEYNLLKSSDFLFSQHKYQLISFNDLNKLIK